MKNGILHIDLFTALDEIKDQYDHTDVQWAKAAYGKKECQSRISELRSKAKKPGYTGRAFTFEKFSYLFNGLKKLIGDDVLKKELLKRVAKLEKAGRNKEAIILLVMAMSDRDESPTLLYLKSVMRVEDK